MIKFIISWWWNVLNETKSQKLINYTLKFFMLLPKTETVMACIYSLDSKSYYYEMGNRE